MSLYLDDVIIGLLIFGCTYVVWLFVDQPMSLRLVIIGLLILYVVRLFLDQPISQISLRLVIFGLLIFGCTYVVWLFFVSQ